MAEEQEPEVAPAPKRSRAMRFILPASVVLFAACLALFLYNFFVKERLLGPSDATAQEDDALSTPTDTVTVDFEDFTTNAKLNSDEGGAAPLFIYSVTLECSNQKVADIVLANKPRFRDIIGRVHEFRTRDELNDPLFKKSITAQVLQETNQALNDLLRGEAGPQNRITAVFYHDWFIYDR